MLETKELTKIYPGPVPALRGIDLTIGEGIFGLLGPNGAGKSTFMNIVTGGLMPTSGTVRLDGHDIVADPQHVRTRLGYLPQSIGFPPHLHGAAALDLLLSFKGVGPRRDRRRLVAELLEAVNLTEAARRKVGTYSGGMLRRLGIAQAIAGDPRLIVLDEPTAGLDPGERVRLYELLLRIAENRIIVLSTHIVEDVSTTCGRVAVIGHGRCLLDAPCADARARLEGRLFEITASMAEPAPVPDRAVVTQRQIVEGSSIQWRFVLDETPPDTAIAVVPTLADAYFHALTEGAAAA
jgi:ABC-2 type transport system ATP-binding protein